MSDNDGSRIDAGRLFQTRGPLTVYSVGLVAVFCVMPLGVRKGLFCARHKGAVWTWDDDDVRVVARILTSFF